MDQNRKKRLKKLINSPLFGGNSSSFNEAMGWSSGRASQLLDPEEPFGERAARNIVAKLKLQPNYFEIIDTEDSQAITTGLLGDGSPPKDLTLQDLGLIKERKAPTAMALMLADLFDELPESDVIRRSLAYAAASHEIVRVLQGEKPIQLTQLDQKKP